jgi:hypothetical protein
MISSTKNQLCNVAGALLIASAFFCLFIVPAQAQSGAPANSGAVPQANGATPQAADFPRLDFVFEEIVNLSPAVRVGQTPLGGRQFIPITGGTFAGPKLKGKILSGGWDWQLALPNGCSSIKADYMIQTDDGSVINVLNKGTLCAPSSANSALAITSPSFEAPNGRYEWLNNGAYVGTLEMVRGVAGTIRIRFYQAH